MHVKSSGCPLCHHTKSDGLRCKSPALATSAFCYFHQKHHRARPATISPGPFGKRCFRPLQDRQTIQRALSRVVQGLASNRISLSRAGKTLYALQLAISEIGKPQ